jgi:hypothetical protein
MVRDVATGKLFVKLMVRVFPAGTMINGGCHVLLMLPAGFVVLLAAPAACATRFIAVQVAASGAAVPVPPAVTAVPVPHTQPHMGTVLPSGRVVVCLVAVRFTVDCAKQTPTDNRRIVSANVAVFKTCLRWLDRMYFFLITEFRQ